MSCTMHTWMACSGCCLAPAVLQVPHRYLLFRALSSGPEVSRSLRESYRLLQLPDQGDCSPTQVREAYLRLAKLYHPDSGAATADPVLFARVEEAYRSVLAHRRQVKTEEEDDDGGEVKGVSPQRRHYLSYEGVGSGTPSQRQRRYQQFRVDRAVEQVLDYRQRGHERAAASEGALAERDVRRRSRESKITQAVERLVEDLIQESMARGDFSNLSGAGKPLSKFQHNPYADPMTHNLNRILIDNGYQPPWIVTQRDIRETAAIIRGRLLEGRRRLGDPMEPRERDQWEQLCGCVGGELLKLNKMVDDFNLIVPMLSMQMVHFSLAREVDRAEKDARQQRLDQEKVMEEEQRKQEVKSENVTARSKGSKQSLMSWMQGLLRGNNNFRS